VYETLDIGFSILRVMDDSIKVAFQNVLGGDQAWCHAFCNEEAVLLAGVTNTDMTKTIHNAFVVEYFVCYHQVFNEGVYFM
jgi:hypothetical protein